MSGDGREHVSRGNMNPQLSNKEALDERYTRSTSPQTKCVYNSDPTVSKDREHVVSKRKKKEKSLWQGETD